MASSTSTVAWLSVMVKHLQTVVKERTILKCSWDDSFGSLLLKFGCDDLEAETIHKVIVSIMTSSRSVLLICTQYCPFALLIEQ